MPTNLQIRRGLQSALPTGLAGEPLFTTDTKRLYISDGTATNLLQGAATLLTTGAIPFSDANGKLTMSASNLYWDDTNNRLGIGTASPAVKLQVFGTNELLRFGDGTANNDSFINFNNRGYVGYKVSGGLNFISNTFRPIIFGVGGSFSSFTEAARFAASTGNFAIGTTTDAGFKLDVNGTARVSGQLTLGGSVNLSTDSTLSIGNATSRILGLYVRAIASGNNTMDILAPSINFADASSNIRLKIFGGTGNVTIQNGGTFTDAGFKLDVNGTARIVGALRADNTLLVNGTSINGSAIAQFDSGTRGFLPPRMTTTQKNAIATPATGLVVFDTTLGKLCVFSTTWQTVTSV